MNKVNPTHYDLEIKGHKFMVVDIMEAVFLNDAHLSQAIKYLLRAGKKTSESYIDCVGKCLWWCARAIWFHKGRIDLPPDIPIEHITVNGRPITYKKPRKGT